MCINQYIPIFSNTLQSLFPYGIIDNSSFEKTFKTITDIAYIITAIIIATIVANLSDIIPFMLQYVKYEHIPIIAVATTGLNTNFLNPRFSFIFFLRAVIAIVNATI